MTISGTLDPVRLMDYPDSTEEIPTIDISGYLAGKPRAQKKVAAQLRETTETVGFFYLKGHGIPQAVIDCTFAESRRFHELPLEEKMAIPLVNNGVIRTGYQPSAFSLRPDAKLNIIEGAKPDLNDFMSINREPGASELYRTKNVWPRNLPGFREAILDYHARMESLAMKFLPLWATSLELPADYFDKFFTDPQLTLSLVHYGPQKVIGKRQYGIAPHADSTFMTLLAQAGEPALAVEMPSGHWRMVDVIPGTLLVNTGSTIARWTNDRYLSTKHRVINTNNVDRYSLAAFFGPNAEAMIECLPTCQGPGNPPRYPAISYAEFRRSLKTY